jgi:2-polyprenyl-3-methyl-5-hydroxy-6-metoxy-1,4-benzoquinol methylase
MTYQPAPSELEHVPCPACGVDSPTPQYDFSPYRVVQCSTCRLSYLSPRLDEATMLRFYQDDSYFENGDIGYAGYLQQEASLRYSFRRFLRQLHRRGLAGGALLEVGCGYGFLLDEAKPYFDHRVGIDLSPAVERAAARADRVYQGGLEALPAGERFDCIILLSVIEHVHTPVDYLRTVGERLRPGGKVVVATPNVDSIWRRLLGPRWPAFQVVPEHVSFYNGSTLSALLTRAGFIGVTALPFVRAYPANMVIEEFNVWPNIFGPLGTRNVAFPGYIVARCGFAAQASHS